ncbi:MAG: OmpH family outer membrane protein [Alphaproteobacteria bacterium]|nr:OmpH family outer membrane protein [Alphaproteobacteria bacterium]
MMKTTAMGRLALVAAGALFVAMLPGTAPAQQDPGFFVPGQQRPQGAPPPQQGQRPPAQGQQQQGQQPQQGQRPPQQGQQGQRPPTRTDAPQPLPPGQPPPAAVIGIVDVPEVQRVSTAFSQVREEIERRRTRLNDDLQREQNAWREAQQELAAQRATLGAEVVRLRERDLQDRITESQRIFRNRSQSIEQSAQQALVQIEESLGTVIRQVAQSRSVNIVLPRPLVILNEPPFDLTEEIAQQFNRVLPRVTIPPESDGRAATPAPGAPATPRQTPPPAQPPRPAQPAR